MSKMVTIPENHKPFIVNINNREYIYRGGETVEVPDDVAEVIADAIALEPKPGRYLGKLAKLAENSLTVLTAEDLAGISAIARCAFYSNIGLKSITIPDNIIEIGEDAFSWCVNSERVYLPEVPPTMSVDAFKGVRTTCIFYCKTQASLDAYKAAPFWSTLTGTYTFVVEE